MILIVGVPGTGKTVIGVNLARRVYGSTKFFHTLSWLVLERAAWLRYDQGKRSFVVDGEKVCRVLSGLGEPLVLESSWAGIVELCGHPLPSLIVVTRTNPLVLLRRLKRRGYPWSKVVENVEAEFMGVVAVEAYEIGKTLGVSVLEVESTSTVEAVIDRIMASLRGRGGYSCCIDWSRLLKGDELEELLRIFASRST